MKGKRKCRCDGDRLPMYVAEAIEGVGGLGNLQRSIPSGEEIAYQAKVCKALSNTTRLTILWSVASCEMCPCVLKEFLKVGDSTLSYHLDLLEEAGLVTSRPEKNWRIYGITDKGRKALKGWMEP
ncbi:MAG TPA: winged helix-turn-helix transcriptional regulator [Methanomassiliicoccales archaeon]|nr:winged helix-turn-helix transcriptional regulator [Methanomassiliicoccales archaeon]